MLVAFGSDIKGCNFERLEWLTVILNLVVKKTEEEGELDEKFGTDTSRTQSASSTTVDNDGAERACGYENCGCLTWPKTVD